MAPGSACGGTAAGGAGQATLAVLDAAVALLREHGATVLDPVDLPGADGLEEPEFAALRHEFKHDLNRYLAGLPGPRPRSLAELIDYNLRNAREVLVHFGQELFEQAEAASEDPADPAARAARAEARARAREALDGPLTRVPARRDRHAHRQPGLADRPCARRP